MHNDTQTPFDKSDPNTVSMGSAWSPSIQDIRMRAYERAMEYCQLHHMHVLDTMRSKNAGNLRNPPPYPNVDDVYDLATVFVKFVLTGAVDLKDIPEKYRDQSTNE